MSTSTYTSSPHVGIIRNKLAVLHRAYDGVAAAANSHRTIRRDFRAAERKWGERHEIREPKDHVEQRHRLGHLLDVRGSRVMGIIANLALFS